MSRTFEDLQRLAMTSPTVYAGLMFYRNGDLSLEEAMLAIIFKQEEQKKEIEKILLSHIQEDAPILKRVLQELEFYRGLVLELQLNKVVGIKN